MPIDPRMVKWDEEPAGGAAIDARMVKWDEEPSLLDKASKYLRDEINAIPKNVGNLAAGAVRGAGSIGATLLAPVDVASDLMAGKGLTLDSNRQRRADMDATLRDMGANPDDYRFKVGKLASEVAGTAPLGGMLGNALGKVSPVLGDAVASGGFSTGLSPTTLMGKAGDMGVRMAGGAINGAATAAAVNPDDAGTGALIGGALPPAAKLAGKAGQMVANALRNASTPQEVRAAQQLAAQLGVTEQDLRAAVTGPQMIPGYQPTVPQIVQDPVASQLQRTLQTAGQQSVADVGRVQQAQFRDALQRVAPLRPDMQDAAQRAGSAIQDFAIPAERQASNRVNALFDAIPPDQAMMQLPLQAMQNAQSKYLGPGTFGKGGASAEQAMQAATNIGMDQATLTPRVVPFDQIQALRSSIGEALNEAKTNGRNQAAAALTSMKNAIDNKVADVAAGRALPGEVFTPEAVDTWGQALAAHAAKKSQFATGPQAAMFRMGADGQPAIQGAEIPGKFFNGNRSQVEDVQAFKRLIGDRQDLAQEMKSYALTQGMDTAKADGALTSKFIDWMKSRSGANKELFNPQELATIKEVGKAVERQLTAENLARVSGSDTAQKLASLQSNGLLDSKGVDLLARRIPVLSNFTGPALDGLRSTAARSRGAIQAGLLADPLRMADALSRVPGLLNFEPIPLGLLTSGARVAPLLGAD